MFLTLFDPLVDALAIVLVCMAILLRPRAAFVPLKFASAVFLAALVLAGSVQAGEPPAYKDRVANLDRKADTPAYTGMSPGCECVSLSGACTCKPCECDGSTVRAAVPAVEYEAVQVCENGVCRIYYVQKPSQKSDPKSAKVKPPAPTPQPPTVTPVGECGTCGGGSYTAPVESGRVFHGFHPFQRLREWNQNRPKLFGGGRLRGGCSSCGG